MTDFIYLMKNGDLFKLGSTKNLETEANKLKPGKIISSLKPNNSKSFEARLLRRYKKKRIPDTNYFRLSEKEVEDCKKYLEGKRKLPESLDDELGIGMNASLLFSSLTFVISVSISKMPIFSLLLSILFASLPMWSLAIIGSFGGYDAKDLAPFSTISNRLKGFLIAISMASIFYILFEISGFSIN